MRTAVGLALLALASLTLTALRYGPTADADDRFQAALATRLARADSLVVAVETLPALRVLHLRRIGCTGGWRLAFAPDDGGSASALYHLMPGAVTLRVPADTPLRAGWIILADVGAEACLTTEDALRLLNDTNG